MNFNVDRFLKQFKWDVLQNYRFLYIGYLVLIGFMMLQTAFDYNAGSGLFGFTLFIGGLIFTSTVFDEMNHPQPKQFYLTTPSSHLEKFGSKLLLSTIVYTVLTMVLFVVISFVTTTLIELRTGRDLEYFNPFFGENIEIIKSYLIIQSIFLLGAVTFRQVSFLKTLAIIIGIGFVLSSISLTIGIGSLIQYFPWKGDIDVNMTDIDKDGIEGTMDVFLKVVYWLYLLLLAPLMWLISYFKLTEKEV